MPLAVEVLACLGPFRLLKLLVQRVLVLRFIVVKRATLQIIKHGLLHEPSVH